MTTHTPHSATHAKKPAQSGGSLLDVQHLHKAFGGNQAVNDVSFNLQAGELLALIGPNGAGNPPPSIWSTASSRLTAAASP